MPLIILEPAKPLAGYLIGTGHFFTGAVTFIAAEVLKLTFVERLFQLNREKLLSIRVFAWGYQYWRHLMDVIEFAGNVESFTKACGECRTCFTGSMDAVSDAVGAI